MAIGPTTVFDKSALESLSLDEAMWFDTFYRSNITPLFLVETLADLEKEVAKGRTPEQVVGNLAEKTPVRGSLTNVHHQTLCAQELLGNPIEMRGRPIIASGRPASSGSKRGLVFDRPPEMEALARWQKGDFLAAERMFAREWRANLTSLDLQSALKRFRAIGLTHPRVRDLAEAKAVANYLLHRDGYRFASLKLALDLLGAPPAAQEATLARWKALGGPRLPEFAPYVTHVVTVDLLFYLYLGLGIDQISAARPGNKIDMAYLYYLPFTSLFVSKDRLHQRTVPLFLQGDQEFIWAEDLKVDLSRLDAHFMELPETVREQGVVTFAANPPDDTSFLTTRLWDKYLPRWRERGYEPRKPSKADSQRIAALSKAMTESSATPGMQIESDEADVIVFERMIPIRMGKWRLVSPDVEAAAREKRGSRNPRSET